VQPALAKQLKYVRTDCAEIRHPNTEETKLKKGKILAQHFGPESVMKWSDKKNVTAISTYHGDEMRKVNQTDRKNRKISFSSRLQSKHDEN
jgi:hypothetical protein